MEYQCSSTVFWSYDLYPYCLGGYSSKFKLKDDGTVSYYVPSYSMWVSAIKVITDDNDATQTLKQLEDIRKNFDDEKSELSSKFNRKLGEIVPWMKK